MVVKAKGTSKIKRYVEVANSLIAEIVNGRYTLGTLLPTEHELATHFAVSRQTVRAALTIMKERGYITRKKAVGSLVESINPSVAYSQSVSTIEDLIQVAMSEVRSIESTHSIALDRVLARQLEAPVGSEWIHMSGPRIDAKSTQAGCWANIFINTAYAGALETIRQQPQMMISDILEKHYAITISEVRQTVFAVLIEGDMARRLNVEDRSAGLRILRHYKDDQGQLVELTETVYPAKRISVSTHLKRVTNAAK
ncbi:MULTISPECIES: GntR family transcriptional regulator [Pseudomonas]|uniref:Transcriptional regulator, GntR family n=1 Tax=Pseudomonas asplenii TaxID=53407 RepID=A0A1H1ZN23_9PSED|nr:MULTISPECIES: GntR family transcriptional regulator [Pseudomonas]MCK6191178.1 GntR family transcriptional regulator [Pseudomonas sp. EYE_354]OPA90864.1 GntR family transcriptional regulator [Pseudomonas fluorescens]SDT34967.1 transcriptional regulator, GntR family [Pseudomonas asplenii]